MTFPSRPGRVLALLIVGWLALLAPSVATAREPTFPALSGRVVDQAGLLNETTRTSITHKLAALETDTGAQVVVVTLADLQDYEIEDYGYRLGRAWGIGDAQTDKGALLIVAPAERKVRIEVGYGLEPVLTDAMSSHIIQTVILPRFREGGFSGGTEAGVDAIGEQLRLDPDQAQARIAALPPQEADLPAGVAVMITLVFIFLVLSMIRGAGGRRRRRGGGLGPILVWGASEALRNSSRGGGGFSGGEGFGSGGGFSGGGGGFGGGGASGGW